MTFSIKPLLAGAMVLAVAASAPALAADISGAGAYLVDWDLVSEGECWFAECGEGTARLRIQVRIPGR